jgi:hypothetical protein
MHHGIVTTPPLGVTLANGRLELLARYSGRLVSNRPC